MLTTGKWAYCKKILTENPDSVFIGWFDETIAELENYFAQAGLKAVVLKARTTNKSQVKGSAVIFIEHFTMKTKEEQFLQQLEVKENVILTALDEPMLSHFGGEKLIKIMQSLGMKEDEVIEHKMVSQSIATAQEKIDKKVVVEHSAISQAEWMERNLKQNNR